MQLHKSQDNHIVNECYAKHLEGGVGGPSAHRLLHTKYQNRRRILGPAADRAGERAAAQIAGVGVRGHELLRAAVRRPCCVRWWTISSRKDFRMRSRCRPRSASNAAIAVPPSTSARRSKSTARRKSAREADPATTGAGDGLNAIFRFTGTREADRRELVRDCSAMGDDNPARQVVFTNKAQCRDCYRCVRVCPVKAIRMHGGQAAVVEERCIACGTCVRECPQQAKSFRDDVDRTVRLLASGAPVAASIAPRFAAVYPEWQQRRLDLGPAAVGILLRRRDGGRRLPCGPGNGGPGRGPARIAADLHGLPGRGSFCRALPPRVGCQPGDGGFPDAGPRKAHPPQAGRRRQSHLYRPLRGQEGRGRTARNSRGWSIAC